jgi:hypothetical protein
MEQRVIEYIDEEELGRHIPYGLALRRDLVTVDGYRIPAWSEIVAVGEPDNKRTHREAMHVDIVVVNTAGRPNRVELIGQIFSVRSWKAYIALGEVEGECECEPDDILCRNRRKGA